MPFQQRQPCTTTSTQVKGKPANLIVILLAHSLLLELIMLLFLNWGDLQGHSTSLKICSKAKYFRIKCTIHNVAWHAYGTCKYAGSHMHPKHDQQETSLNMKGGGDSQNLRGQEIFRSSNCTNEEKCYFHRILGGGASSCKLTHPLFLNI